MSLLIDPTATRTRHLPTPPGYGMALTLLLLLTGCAANTPNAAVSQKTSPYYQDAQLCRAKNPAKPAVPGVDPAVSLNAPDYLKCMNQLGYQQDAKTDPLLVALKKCQQPAPAGISASGATTIKTPKPTAVRECLKQRGFPSAGKPPASDTAAESSSAPIATLKLPAKNAPKPATAKSGKERVQTVYIPKKTPAAQ